jgi:hypothetical protein
MSYENSIVEQKTAAVGSYFTIIQDKAIALREIGEDMKSNAINAANLTRECGQAYQAAMDKRQMKFEHFENFYREHARQLPDWFTSATARKMISAYEKHPEPITDFRTALNVLEQTTFFAVGLLDEPKRLLAQTAVGKSAIETVMSIWQKQDEALAKLKEEKSMDDWSNDIWQTVVDATKASADLNALGIEKLNRKRNIN